MIHSNNDREKCHIKKPLTSIVKGLLNMALQPGLEPGTHGLTVHCLFNHSIAQRFYYSTRLRLVVSQLLIGYCDDKANLLL